PPGLEGPRRHAGGCLGPRARRDCPHERDPGQRTRLDLLARARHAGPARARRNRRHRAGPRPRRPRRLAPRPPRTTDTGRTGAAPGIRAGAWGHVRDAIAHMSETQANEPAWIYWRARAMQALREPDAIAATVQARALYDSIASPNGFYEQLALEEPGHPITPPA